MSEKEPTQTTPQGEELPVPKRGEFLKNLRKVAKADEKPADDSTPSSPKK